jgi:preprotein translocase SecE subunit
VKNTPATSSTSFLNPLAVGSLVGGWCVVAGLALILFGLPALWWDVLGLSQDLVTVCLLLGAMVAVAAGLLLGGARLVGPSAPHGLRAGIFMAFAGLFFLVLLVQIFGVTLENWDFSPTVGIPATLVFAAILVFFYIRAFFRTSFEKWLVQVEDQGWFTTTSYKASQGLRVRRGTMLGLLAVAACGIYTMWIRNPLVGDWALPIPFVDDWSLVLLPFKKFTLTLFLALGSLWFAWRVVNYPTFADFLIATEAEMNKVSWTTRKRLFQDTIVVLVTVILLTVFLFVVDVLWIKILSNKYIRVLHIDTTATQQVNPATEKPEY